MPGEDLDQKREILEVGIRWFESRAVHRASLRQRLRHPEGWLSCKLMNSRRIPRRNLNLRRSGRAWFLTVQETAELDHLHTRRTGIHVLTRWYLAGYIATALA